MHTLRKLAEGTNPQFWLRDALLFCVDDATNQGKLVVPLIFKDALLKEYHDNMSHLGVNRTLNRLSKRYWFPHM